MKKTLLKVVALIMAVALVLPTLPTTVSAATWDNVPETTYASRYTSSDYATGKFYDNMTKIPLTGDGARDVVAVAASQMGYLEGDSTSAQDGETGGSGNYTEYGAYTNVNASAWCASFCSWCIYAAEVTDTRGTTTYMARNGYYWAECYVPYWSNMLYDNGRYRFSDYYRSSYDSSQASYTPQPGDLIFFTAGYEPLDEGHIGLVAYSDGTYVYTLEGNTSSQDGVESEGGGAFFKKYLLSSSSIAGYGILPYETNNALPEIDYTGENPTPGLYVNPSGAKAVYADIEDTTASWTLPMSSVFEVLTVDKDSSGNTMLYSKCEINGSTVYGWIVNGSGSGTSTLRTLQIYATTTEYDDSNDQNHDGIPDSFNPTKDDEGNYTFENAYGYEFDIDGVDGTIAGEDAYIITTSTAYESCNPNWAISVQLRPTGNANEYKVVKVVVTPGSASAAGITLEDNDIIMVVHSASSAPGSGYANWMDKVAAMALKEGDVVNVASDYSSVTVPTKEDSNDPEDPDNPDEPDDPIVPDEPKIEETIFYQLNDDSTDVRLIAYVDALEAYSKVSFTLTIGDKVSKPLECTTGYNGLYANGELKTTEDIYGVDGYFVTYTIKRYLDVYAGQEVTITVTYTTVTGETITEERTVTIGAVKEEETTPSKEYNYGGVISGAGLQGSTDNVYYGCDLSFWNVDDTSYAYGSSLTDDGADYSLVDFEAMKADGCDFVILRFGSEDSTGKYYDPHFVTYYKMAREAGLDIGLYYYSYALTSAEAAEEAEYVISIIESYDMYFEYPLYIDIEESDQLALGETALSNVCYGWCGTMVEEGYFPGIYGNYNLYDGISSQVKADYDFWLAYVSSATSASTYNPSNTNVSDECSMWQYSFYGYEYDGIGKDMLDVNVSYKDYPAIMEAYGYNNVK